MAEAVGLAASIIQIAGAGAKLSVTLYNFTTSAVHADQDIRDIADDVELTSNALESIGKVFESEDAKSIVSKKAIQDANNIIMKCESVFNEVSEMVEKRMKVGKDGKRGLSVGGKLLWAMKEQRIELYRRRLESLKNSLVLLLHVLQLAQGQARGKMENSVMQEEREKIRELHQRQQDSLKSLQALESRFCKVRLDDEETLQGSNISSRVRTMKLMLSPQSATLPPIQRNPRPTVNAPSLDILEDDTSETSESDVTATNDEGERLSFEELAKCARHVQKLLKRITRLQQSFDGSHRTRLHRKRRVQKIYQRFRREFESDFSAPPPPNRVSKSLPGFDWFDDPENVENIDFDSFLTHDRVDASFPYMGSDQTQELHMRQDQGNHFKRAKHLVPRTQSYTAATVSSTNSAPIATSQRSPPVVPATTAPVAAAHSPLPKTRRPTVSDSRQNSTNSSPRPKPLSRTASQSSRPSSTRRPTITQDRPERKMHRDSRDSRVDPECTDSICTARGPNAHHAQRLRPEIQPSQSTRPQQRPMSYSGEPRAQYWVPEIPEPYPSLPQEWGPLPSNSAGWRNMAPPCLMPPMDPMGPPMPPYMASHPQVPGYAQFSASSYDGSQRPGMPSRNSSNLARNEPPPLIIQAPCDQQYSAKYGQPQPQSSTQARFPAQLRLQDEAYESESESESESEEEDEYEQPHPRDPRARRALMPPPKITRTKSKSKKERPPMPQAKTNQIATVNRRMSQVMPAAPRQTESDYVGSGTKILVNKSTKAERRRSGQVYDKSYKDYVHAKEIEERNRADTKAAAEAKVFKEAKALARDKAREDAQRKAYEERCQAERAERERQRGRKHQRRNSKVYYQPPPAFDNEDEEEDESEEEEILVSAPAPLRRRRPTEVEGRKGKERIVEQPKVKRIENAAEDYISAQRGCEHPLNEHTHRAAKKASKVSPIPSYSGSSSSDRQSQSNCTTMISNENEIRVHVDASAPLSPSFNGDMESRTLRMIPAENGMADIVISSHDSDISLSPMTPSSPQSAPKGRRGPLTAELRKEAHKMRMIGACSNCKGSNLKCDHNTPCSNCVARNTRNEDLPDETCRGSKIAERAQGLPIGVENIVPPLEVRASASISHDASISQRGFRQRENSNIRIRQPPIITPARHKSTVSSLIPPQQVTELEPGSSSSGGYATFNFASIPGGKGSFPSMYELGFGQADVMSLPEINIDFAPPSRQAFIEEPRLKHRGSSSMSSTSNLEELSVIQGSWSSDDEVEQEEKRVERKKRRKLISEKEEPTESEDPTIVGDRDIVDVLLEQWTVPVY